MALVFMITYIGGIAVMFLFLILVLDVNTENTKPKRALFKNIYLVLFMICAILFSTEFLLGVYNPFLFNNFEFFEFVTNNIFETLESLISFSDISKNFDFCSNESLSNHINLIEFLTFNYNSCGKILSFTHEYL